MMCAYSKLHRDKEDTSHKELSRYRFHSLSLYTDAKSDEEMAAQWGMGKYETKAPAFDSEEEKIQLDRRDRTSNDSTESSSHTISQAPLPLLSDPFECTNKIHLLVTNHMDFFKRKMEVQRELEFHRLLEQLSSNYYDLLKYGSTPVPFPTTQMAQTTLLVWVILLPIFFFHRAVRSKQDDDEDDGEDISSDISIPSLLVAATCSFLGTYGFWGLERVAEELDLPFGDDADDIEINVLASVSFHP